MRKKYAAKTNPLERSKKTTKSVALTNHCVNMFMRATITVNNMNLDNLNRYGVEIEFLHPMSSAELVNHLTFSNRSSHLPRISEACYTDRSDTWRIKPDCSVRRTGGQGLRMQGHELVSPILRGEADLETLLGFVDAIEASGGVVNRTCGLHVHVDMNNMPEKRLVNLFKLAAKYQGAIDSLLPRSRRGDSNGYCQNSYSTNESLNNVFKRLRMSLTQGNMCETVDDLMEVHGRDRNLKWNFQSYWRHGTVEMRAHSGTLNRNKVEHWVRLVQGMVHFAATSSSVKTGESTTTTSYDASHLLRQLIARKSIPAATSRFYRKRHKQLNPAGA